MIQSQKAGAANSAPTNQNQRQENGLPGSMKLKRPLQVQRQLQS
jgi:hypothetical protein